MASKSPSLRKNRCNQLRELIERMEEQTRSMKTQKQTNTARARADIYHATDVELTIKLGIGDLKNLFSKKEVVIEAVDSKPRKDQYNMYKVRISYGGKAVPTFLPGG